MISVTTSAGVISPLSRDWTTEGRKVSAIHRASSGKSESLVLLLIASNNKTKLFLTALKPIPNRCFRVNVIVDFALPIASATWSMLGSIPCFNMDIIASKIPRSVWVPLLAAVGAMSMMSSVIKLAVG